MVSDVAGSAGPVGRRLPRDTGHTVTRSGPPAGGYLPAPKRPRHVTCATEDLGPGWAALCLRDLAAKRDPGRVSCLPSLLLAVPCTRLIGTASPSRRPGW